MKTAIIHASVHHENTKKLVDHVAKMCDVTLIDAQKVKKESLSEYDLIGFASGIFYTRFHPSVLDFAKDNLPEGKNVFFMATAGNPIDRNFHTIEEVAKKKHAKVIGRFQCKGFDTFGPLKILGGIKKGHPNEDDLKDAVAFFKKLSA